MLTAVAKTIEHCRSLGSGSVNQRIALATLIVMAGTLVVKVAATVKDILIARHFGLGDDLDALLMALVIPIFVTAVFGATFNAGFMPAYVRVRERDGAEAAKRLFANVMLLSIGMLLACIAVMAAAAGPLLKLLAAEFSPEKRKLLEALYFLLLPTVVLGGQISLWGAVLNAREKFALNALAPIVSPLAILVSLVTLVPRLGIGGVAWAIVLGAIAELAILGTALARRGMLPAPRWWRDMAAETRVVLQQYAPTVAAQSLMCGTALVNSAMVSWLGPGAVSALNYGNKIPTFLAAAGMTALGSAVMPHFSRLVAVNDHAAIRHTLSTFGRWLLILSVPATLAFMAGSEWMVRILFERGAFGPDDTAAVTLIQQMYLIQLPFVVLGMLGVRLLVAMGKCHLLTVMSAVNLAMCVIGNLAFMYSMGASGIALSTSIMYIVSSTMIWGFVYRHAPWRAQRQQRAAVHPGREEKPATESPT